MATAKSMNELSKNAMENVGIVYAIRHNPTGKIYVGSTTDLISRIAVHMSKLRNNQHPCVAMQRDFNEHGDDYSAAILYKNDPNKTDLTQVEHDYMEILNTRDPDKGYNGNDPSNAFDKDSLLWSAVPKIGNARTKKGDFQKGFRTWLFEARTGSGMTQLEVANKAGVSESYYAMIEKGQRQQRMDITLAAKFSSIFNIPLDRIVEMEAKEAETDGSG